MLIMQNLSRKSSNASIGNMNKKLVFSVSILIPVAGLKTIKETIESVMHQKFRRWEILILRNSIQDLPQDTNIIEKDVFYQDHLIREIYIRKKGKGNALNVGICYARNALVCVIDADCILQEDALSKTVKHFQNDEVVAVGGRLLVKREDSSQLGDCKNKAFSNQRNRLFMNQLLSVIPECHIASKDYCIKGTGGKEA